MAVSRSFSEYAPVKPRKGDLVLREGDDVNVRLSLTDETTGKPVRGVDLAGWWDRLSPGEQPEPRGISKQIENHLGGGLLGRAEVDLNGYYALTLNADPTISVVDPQFGFGNTSLLAMTPLAAPGGDWTLTEDRQRLFVSLPETNRVAVIDAGAWTVRTNLPVPAPPLRLALQPDQHYLWAAFGSSNQAGVMVFDADTLGVATVFPTRSRPADFAFRPDNSQAFMFQAREGVVTVVDVRSLRVQREIETGGDAAGFAYSPLANALYVSHPVSGELTVIDAQRGEIIARIAAGRGAGALRFAPGGRLGFLLQPEENRLQILDASRNRLVQSGLLGAHPDQITFTKDFAYVRHQATEDVYMVALAGLGVEGSPLAIVALPAGRAPVGRMTLPTPADGIIPTPDPGSVLIPNPGDRAVYFYMEGMAAPKGSLSNYGREPRAALVWDRNLRERSSPGVYETTLRLPRAGRGQFLFYNRTPKLVLSFPLEIGPGAARAARAGQVKVAGASVGGALMAGRPVTARFQLAEVESQRPATSLRDVQIMVMRLPGVWHRRFSASADGEGGYQIEFVAPAAGNYQAFVTSPSGKLPLENPNPLAFRVGPP